MANKYLEDPPSSPDHPILSSRVTRRRKHPNILPLLSRLLSRLSFLLFSPCALYDPSPDVDQDRNRHTKTYKQHRLRKLIRNLFAPVSTPQRRIKVIFRSKVTVSFVLGVPSVPCPLK